ncbi:hypothetical protein GF373_17360 [bacterium]|nr:hypothetical protein [bacterium]
MVERATFYTWLQLEELKEKIATAVEDSYGEEFVAHFYDYLSTAVDKEKDWSELPWIESRDLFYKIEEVNAPTKPFPILSHKSKPTAEWTYEGRTWFFWLHILSSNYGWDIEYIKQLDVDDAIGLLQEILLEKHEEREFAWRTTEIAYNKDGRFQTLKKPEWMRRGLKPKKVKKQKIRRDFLPVGKVMRWEKDD